MRENQPLAARLGHGGECAVELLRPPNRDSFELETQGVRRLPCSAKARPGSTIGWVPENPTREILGTASLSNSSRFPVNSRARVVNPVMFAPGRPRLAMNPSSTGLSSAAITMGMLLVACFAA